MSRLTAPPATATATGLKPGGPTQASLTSPTDSIMGRKKVLLAPGHSLMDWIRLGRTKGDLSGVGSHKKVVTAQELASHNTPKDIWMAIRGKVYNITPYMDFHPGGTDELMRAAGKDGTELFDEIHNWVNIESMLEKCLVGKLSMTKLKASAPAPPPKFTVEPPSQESNDESLSDLIKEKREEIDKPTVDWYQSATNVTVVVYTKEKELQAESVLVDCQPGELFVEVIVPSKAFSYFLHKEPHKPLKDTVKVSVTKGKVEVSLQKLNVETNQNDNWPMLGKALSMDTNWRKTKQIDSARFRKWKTLSNTEVTHDTRLLSLQAPPGLHVIHPVGRHLVVQHDVSGMQLCRSYTVGVPSLGPESPKDPRVIYLMIKRYQGGALSPYITRVKPGDQVEISSRYGGTFDVAALSLVSCLVLFMAGTGFTSGLTVMRYALFGMSNSTFPVKLIFYNKTQKDILWRKELDTLAKSNPRFTVHHILSREPEDSGWSGKRGRVSSEDVDKFVPVVQESSSRNPFVLVSGPWAFNDQCESLLKLHGLADKHMHIFSQTT